MCILCINCFFNIFLTCTLNSSFFTFFLLLQFMLFIFHHSTSCFTSITFIYNITTTVVTYYLIRRHHCRHHLFPSQPSFSFTTTPINLPPPTFSSSFPSYMIVSTSHQLRQLNYILC